jgi:anti-sigma-K factor RskA
MNCEQVDEALGAYAIDALDASERRDVHAHLETCRRHDDALRELAIAVESVAASAPDVEPPASLRSRLLEAFDAEVQATSAPTPIEDDRAPRPIESARRRIAIAPAFVYAAAAAVVLLVSGLIVWNVVLQTGENDNSSTITATLSGSAGTGKLTYLQDDQTGIIELDLSDAPAGTVYQAWSVYPDGPVSLGIVDAQGVIAFEQDLSGATAVAITEEPPGGSPAPTTDPVAVAEVPS